MVKLRVEIKAPVKDPPEAGVFIMCRKISGIIALKGIDKNIDNKDILNNIDNNIDSNQYSFKKDFTITNDKDQAAYEIATALNDLGNFALYRSIAKKLTPYGAKETLSETLNDVRIGKEKNKPIKNPAALFNWKAQRKIKEKYGSR